MSLVMGKGSLLALSASEETALPIYLGEGRFDKNPSGLWVVGRGAGYRLYNLVCGFYGLRIKFFCVCRVWRAPCT